ncbi:vitamin K epoxide reductase family protein [Flavobacterium sp. J27]|uniref:vitamin K epoxide reductase family protein n=1 Tax=Flavobacterium sp. J27 TaxID=2060419 RepID=UPI00103020E7|nr:vitamin K epoxide reductase family protein [Flavobacterium sp. J27]
MISIVQKFLQINHYKEERSDFENLFLSHPNYPSLYAVTDSLDLLQVENVAAQVPKEQFEALPDSFLAVVSDEIVLVLKKDSEVIIEKEKGVKQKLSIDSFLLQWNGIVVAIEPNDTAKTIQTGAIKNNKYVLLGILFLILFLFQLPIVNPFYLLYFAVSAVGLFLGIAVIDEKLNKTEGVLSKICSFSEHTSCDSVIKSDSSKLTSWLDFSDLPLLFFGTSLVLFQLSPASFGILNFMSLLSLPVVGYSIWLQKVKLRKWCVLCLGIGLLLVLQSSLFVFYTRDFNFDYKVFFQAVVLVFPIWFFIKPIVLKKASLEQENVKLLKFKRNFSIFSSLEQPIMDPIIYNSLEKIVLGDTTALVTIDLILSPSCGHCHTAFAEGIKLLEQYPNKLKLHVFFNLNVDNQENPYGIVAKTLFHINKHQPEQVLEALQDWHILRMTLKEWKEKWVKTEIDPTVESDLRAQYQWCMSNEYNYTPVKLVNSQLYPQEYDLSELKYFLSELEEKQEAILA